MNEKLDLVKILGDVKKGEPLYSPIAGRVWLKNIVPGNQLPIVTVAANGEFLYFRNDGRYLPYGELMLFPSEDNRDWSTFRPAVGRGCLWKLPEDKRACEYCTAAACVLRKS